ncbi:MAG TPA: hypothetical protein DD723_05400 [Candidatus Omnitrophica bacterium]|nr:MAG: hypothetical protein A2Z81_05655 [Omnitrophica WOR_2 bacterium GWA2_45_18]HBR14965.1 hypothetical protein [Candidatus Omnitrophota bacterium]
MLRGIGEDLCLCRIPSVSEILITGYASEENLKEAERLQVAYHIDKPFNIQDFLEVIKRDLKRIYSNMQEFLMSRC